MLLSFQDPSESLECTPDQCWNLYSQSTQSLVMVCVLNACMKAYVLSLALGDRARVTEW